MAGEKTVTSVAAELFAGVARLASRYQMIAYNNGAVTAYWGPAGVTTSTGFPLLPGDSVVLQFDVDTATPVYFIAASNCAVRVVELA